LASGGIGRLEVLGERLLLLRNPYSEFSFRSSSWQPPYLPDHVQLRNLSSYEGFSTVMGGKGRKLLAGFAFSPASPLKKVEFDGQTAFLDHGDFAIEYSLEKGGPGLKLSVSGHASWLAPILELRDVFGETLPARVYPEAGAVRVDAGDFGFRLSGGREFEVKSLDLDFEAFYPEGSGFRRGDPPQPIPEKKRVQVLFEVRIGDGGVLRVVPFPSVLIPSQLAPDADGAVPPPSLFKLQLPAEVMEALQRRFFALSRFGVVCGACWLPDAGAWWFRQVWSRDLFQGLLFSIKALHETPWGRSLLWRAAEAGIGSYSPDLGLPNRLCVGPQDGNADGLPLMLLFLARLLKLEWREAYGRATFSVAKSFLFSGRRRGLIRDDWVVSQPWGSWWDSRIWVGGALRSTRLPDGWEDVGGRYALPEVNALFASAYSELAEIAPLLGEDPAPLLEFSASLVGSLKRVNKGYLPSIYDVEGGKGDYTPSSVAIMAYAILQGIQDLGFQGLWEGAISKLMVKKEVKGLKAFRGNKLAFGVLVRPGPGPYFGDREYHGAVSWPRDTPYLIMSLKGRRDDLVSEILVSNLDATVSDGALFFVPELYSLDRDAIVPVKNPAQFWSNWVDPYLDFAGLVADFYSRAGKGGQGNRANRTW